MRPVQRILKNAVRCAICEDVIESKHRHDFKWCECGNTAVDGGKEYLRRIGKPSSFIELSEIIEVPMFKVVDGEPYYHKRVLNLLVGWDFEEKMKELE